MKKIQENTQLKHIIIYALTLLFTLHLTPAFYINSSFLEGFMSSQMVGYMYAISSAITIVAVLGIRQILGRLGNYRTFMFILIVEFISLLLLAFATNPIVVIGAFIASFTAVALSFFHIDIFLENISSDTTTGGTRGIYLTSLNLAFVLGPLITSLILKNGNFWKIYALGAILLLPVFYILIRYTRNFKDPEYQKPDVKKVALHIWKDKNLHNIFCAGFLLRFFFSWMTIYTPLFLIERIGFTISETTLIIGVSLIPYVLLEAWLGKLADEKYGEKEILTIGFIITAIVTGTMTFITNPSLGLWIGLLFATRIGASMIEVMTETYLFKKVDSTDINIIGFYRIVRPFAYIIGPITASLLLLYTNITYLFIVLAIIMLYGIRFSLSLKDTK